MSHLFPTSSKKEVHKLAKELISRLFGLEEESQQDVSSSSADSEDLEACLASSERNSKKIVEQKASYNLAEDLKYFDKTENLSPNLKLLYSALRQISPTSVPSEREFSVSAGIMTKKRDDTLDNLCFLKSTYKKEPKGITISGIRQP